MALLQIHLNTICQHKADRVTQLRNNLKQHKITCLDDWTTLSETQQHTLIHFQLAFADEAEQQCFEYCMAVRPSSPYSLATLMIPPSLSWSPLITTTTTSPSSVSASPCESVESVMQFARGDWLVNADDTKQPMSSKPLSSCAESCTDESSSSEETFFFEEEEEEEEDESSFLQDARFNLTCAHCKRAFTLPRGRRLYYIKRNFSSLPKRCIPCRDENIKRMARTYCPDLRHEGECRNPLQCRFLHTRSKKTAY